MSVPNHAAMLEYCLNPVEGDVWSGSKLRDVPIEERQNTLFLAVCCDATEFQKFSWTPVVVKILNLHPELRVNRDAMLTIAGINHTLYTYDLYTYTV